jgi:uncharacterized protein YqjF (DUF2071 family)
MAGFLEAEWRKLLMINYSIDEKILKPYLPAKTEIDYWNEKCYISLIGFMFLNTRLMGIKIPFHTNFEEVNLRFYVRYKDGNTWKRGVVFIKEIVPKPALTFVANTIYREHYETLPMNHKWETVNSLLHVEYSWKKESWNKISAVADLKPNNINAGSEEEFITEHYWGYTKSGDNKTSEYEVEHPKWKVYKVKTYSVNADFGKTYGNNFEFLSKLKPASVFLAEGSEIKVNSKRKL